MAARRATSTPQSGQVVIIPPDNPANSIKEPGSSCAWLPYAVLRLAPAAITTPRPAPVHAHVPLRGRGTATEPFTPSPMPTKGVVPRPLSSNLANKPSHPSEEK